MIEYLYIIAPDTENNRTIFDEFLILFPVLVGAGMYNANFRIKNDERNFLQIKSQKDSYTPEMIANVEEPQVLTHSEIIALIPEIEA